MVTGTDDVEKHGGQIKVYELSNGHSPATLAGMVGAVSSVAFSPDATLIASASGDAGQTDELRCLGNRRKPGTDHFDRAHRQDRLRGVQPGQ